MFVPADRGVVSDDALLNFLLSPTVWHCVSYRPIPVYTARIPSPDFLGGIQRRGYGTRVYMHDVNLCLRVFSQQQLPGVLSFLEVSASETYPHTAFLGQQSLGNGQTYAAGVVQ